MEAHVKKKIFVISIVCVMTSIQMKTSTSEIFSSNPSLRNKLWQHERMQTEYGMLMEFERRKSKLVESSEKNEIYSNLYVIQTNDTGVKNVSEKYGFTVIRKIFDDEDFYLLKRSKCRRCRRSLNNFLREVGHRSETEWTARQSLRNRVQRFMSQNVLLDEDNYRAPKMRELPLKSTEKMPTKPNPHFNDPLFKEQWYLHNSGQTGTPPENDINVLPVWRSGITGRGITISVLDDGVYGRSSEVADNYDAASSEAYLYLSTDLKPVPEKSHGTYCAAIAAGVANNGVCGVGVAYGAKVGGVRILDGPLTDVQEALALVHALDRVDIYTASWGPTDEGRDVDGPQYLARRAFIKGVTMGRKGKGSIYVWAAGNGGAYFDNCNLDGYASSPFTLTIGALTEDGRSTYYSEPCAAVIASMYVGGSSHTPPSQEKKMQDKVKIKVVVPEGKGKCRETFQGTSAAAPMAAGVLALALQANPDLTWRDIQHIIIRTSRVPDTDEEGWLINRAGFAFHPKMGSGVLDSYALVQTAQKWRSVARLHLWTSPAKRGKWSLLPNEITSISLHIRKSHMHPRHRIDQLETTIATINLQHAHCGDLEMVLESPSSTPSVILTKRPLDNRTTSLKYWDFVTLHFWGEDPQGLWTLRIFNGNKAVAGVVDFFSITLLGTKSKYSRQ